MEKGDIGILVKKVTRGMVNSLGLDFCDSSLAKKIAVGGVIIRSRNQVGSK